RVLAQFRVHADSQTFAEPSVAKANEYPYVIEKYFARSDVPAGLMAQRQLAFGNAYLLTARLHLRAGRYRVALSAWWQAARYSVWSVLRPHSIKLILNGILGRELHYLKQWIRKVFGNKL
ncbi:hypothetical protein, partial [Burkholderia sp. L27(2015)]|uniref:hypothetical protein n=1 Tax=Burkholderia sp. L27(2015) TaxID=1641858 RepID=UPI001C206831